MSESRTHPLRRIEEDGRILSTSLEEKREMREKKEEEKNDRGAQE